jgi:DNA-binding HxlR family transcriptional regulator
VLGERWTLLILRELVGGPRRLVDRTELPPPVARTVYALSEVGWRKVLPVLKAIATFGLDLVEPTESARTPGRTGAA